MASNAYRQSMSAGARPQGSRSSSIQEQSQLQEQRPDLNQRQTGLPAWFGGPQRPSQDYLAKKMRELQEQQLARMQAAAALYQAPSNDMAVGDGISGSLVAGGHGPSSLSRGPRLRPGVGNMPDGTTVSTMNDGGGLGTIGKRTSGSTRRELGRPQQRSQDVSELGGMKLDRDGNPQRGLAKQTIMAGPSIFSGPMGSPNMSQSDGLNGHNDVSNPEARHHQEFPSGVHSVVERFAQHQRHQQESSQGLPESEGAIRFVDATGQQSMGSRGPPVSTIQQSTQDSFVNAQQQKLQVGIGPDLTPGQHIDRQRALSIQPVLSENSQRGPIQIQQPLVLNTVYSLSHVPPGDRSSVVGELAPTPSYLGTLEPTALGSPAVSGFTPFVVNLQHQQPGSNNLARTPRLQPPLRKRRHSGSSLAPKPVKLPKAEKSGQGPMAASRMSSETKEPDDFGTEPMEDIGKSITTLSEYPSNVTGHFCDLFVGNHIAHGKVALKRPRIKQAEYTSEDVRRFLREANAWRSFRHDHILSFIGTCRIAGYLYMVSPFAENGTLIEYVELHPDADRARLLYETAQALAYLHRLGVVHGDIKGTNILVSGDVRTLLCDFGLTKFAVANTSTALKTAGTMRWQSPELWNESPKSFSSDTYAFGMTITEILTGQVPFVEYTMPLKVMKVVSEGERPQTKPMFSIARAPYYPTWRAAIHCWPQEPARRSSMENVVQMLKPRTVPPELTPRDEQAVSFDPGPGIDHSNPLTYDTERDIGSDGAEEGETNDIMYCYCEGDGFGTMIWCEDDLCKVEWFHLSCLGLDSIPQAKWLCLECETRKVNSKD